MSIINYYEVLKIYPKSDLKTIKKAFRKEIAIYHPHNNKSSEASKQFDLIVEAFNVLSNTEKRETFDKILENTYKNVPVLLTEAKTQETYDEWQKEAKTKSRKYKSSPLEELLILDIFIDIGLDNVLSGMDDSLNGIGDALDGVFDLF